ncbi:MAG: hypothetical protein MJ054_00705 [Clostridia bacterium]|nr:hypothetical protein [Clostridia bacterium]
MANYEVTITDGTGSATMELGNYTVSATSAPGYDTSTLSPTSFTVSRPSQPGAFTLTANGTLTIIFNETGAAGGTPITSGTVVMTDSTGTTEYGSAVNIDSNGNAVFNNVPYGSAATGYQLYFKQLTSDDDHEIESNVISVNMVGQTQTEYVQNAAKPVEQSVTLTDANYANLPIQNATLDFTSNV